MKATRDSAPRQDHSERSAHKPPPASRGLAFDALGNRALATLLRSGRLQQRKTAGAPAADPRAIRPLGQLDSGNKLDQDTRGLMESRFGQSFSDVRVHTGHRAAEAAEMVQARAFTSGRDIVFGDGQFAPETTEGRRLLAHELAHVAQQGMSTGAVSAATVHPKLSVSQVGDPLEIEADAAADSVVQGRSPGLSTSIHRGSAVPAIMRKGHDKPTKGQTARDFTVESDHGRTNSYYIKFPHFIEREEALKILFENGTVPPGYELEYQGPMMDGWAFRLRADSYVIEPSTFEKFAPVLQKHFRSKTLALTAEESKARREWQEAFLNSHPIYLGGPSVREVMYDKVCKDHVVQSSIGRPACWGERAGYFYYAGWDSAEGGTVLEARSSPHSPSIIKDWEWFLSHTPADYKDTVGLPYASKFDPNSKATFTLNETYHLENELKTWELQQELGAWISVFNAAGGAVRNPTLPAPPVTGQVLTIASTAIQAYEEWKVALGGEQKGFDMYLMAAAGIMGHMSEVLSSLKPGRPARKAPAGEDPPHVPPTAGAKKLLGSGDPAAITTPLTGPKPESIPGGGQNPKPRGELRAVRPDMTLGPPRRARQVPEPPAPQPPRTPAGTAIPANDNVPLDVEAKVLPRTGSVGVGDVLASTDQPLKPPARLTVVGPSTKVAGSGPSVEPPSVKRPALPEVSAQETIHISTEIGNTGEEVHSIISPDGTAQVTYGDKSTTIKLGETGNNSKLGQELGLPKAHAAQVMADLHAFLPAPPKTLISFAKNIPSPEAYLRDWTNAVLDNPGTHWGSNAFDHPPVEGARLQAFVGEGEQHLSPYALVFEEDQPSQFASMKSKTAQGVTEYQHPSAQVRRSVEVKPRAAVRVNAEGEIDEILHNFIKTGSPEGDKSALLDLFEKLNWKVAKDLVWREGGLAVKK